MLVTWWDPETLESIYSFQKKFIDEIVPIFDEGYC